MEFFISAVTSIVVGIFCFFNGRSPKLGIIGMIGCFVIALVNVILGVLEVLKAYKQIRYIKELSKKYLNSKSIQGDE